MRFRLMSGIVAAACVLAAPAAHAFTFENGENSNPASSYQPPNFNLEEQTKQFSNGSATSTSPASKNQFDTPLGKGTLQFGVGQNNFGSAFGPNFGSMS